MKSTNNLISNKKTKRKRVSNITFKRRSKKNKTRIIKGHKKFKNNRGIRI